MPKTGLYAVKSADEIARLIARYEADRPPSTSKIAIEDLKSGDIFNDEGIPKTYWHIFATTPPAGPPGRWGQHKPYYDREVRYGGPSHWVWQDWGPG
jgi:hypothetical protein